MSETPVRIVDIAGAKARILELAHPNPAAPDALILVSPLVLCWAYLPTLHELSRSFRTRVVELPGCGASSKLSVPWSFEHYSDWLAAFIQHESLTRPLIIGHSNSAPIALLLAAQHPHLVSELVLCDAVGADLTFSLPRTILMRFFDALLEPGLTFRACWHLPYNMLRHTRNFLNQVRLSARFDIRLFTRQFRTPTTLAWGKRDFTMPHRCLQIYQRHIPHARTVISETGSHDWLITNAREFAQRLTHS
ncbi:MAG TPA: alpha/beta fold hydrolase [Tepidisphaeraceae bacterium]|jgi:pimeloyl-ACP methyl ester carboxylesterase